MERFSIGSAFTTPTREEAPEGPNGSVGLQDSSMKQLGTVDTLGTTKIVDRFGIHYPWEEMGAEGSKSELADAVRESLDPSKTTVANMEGNLLGRSVSEILELPQSPHDWVDALLCSSCECLVNYDYLMCAKKGHLTCHQCWEKKKKRPCQFSLTSDNAKLKEVSSGSGDELEPEDDDSSSESSADGAAGREPDGSSSSTDSESGERVKPQLEENHPVAAASGGQLKDGSRLSESDSDTSDDEHWKSMLELGQNDSPNQNSVCGAQLIKQRHIVVDNLLGKVQLYCPNSKKGCEVRLPISLIERHSKEDCLYRNLVYIQGKKKWNPKHWTTQQQKKKKNYQKPGRGDGST